MPETTDFPIEIFISFIHEEEEVAEAVHSFLCCTFDIPGVFMSSNPYLVLAGENWLDRIKAALSSAKVVVAVLSKKSVRRAWVNFEAGAAWMLGRPIIPVCFGGLQKGNLPKPYSNFQALNLRHDMVDLTLSVANHLNRRDDYTDPNPADMAYVLKALDKVQKKALDQSKADIYESADKG